MDQRTGGDGRGQSLARGCGTTALVVLFAVCALALLVLWQIHRALDRSPPDLRGFAHSDTTRTADAAAARTSSARLADLTAALPGAVPLGTSVADSCRTEDLNPFIGRARWAPATCTRSTVVYLAFDGDIRTRLRRLDTTLARQDWVGGSGPARTLTGTATWMGQAGGDPAAPAAQRGSTAPPGSLPICLSTTYGPASQARALPHGGPGVRLRVAVAQSPCPPAVDTGDIQFAGAPERDGTDGAVYLAWHPLLVDRVSRAAYTAHRYVAAFSLVDTYAVQSDPTTSAPPRPTRYGGPPCLSGSHCG